MNKINLRNQDGSLSPEAQLLLSIDLKSFSTVEEKKAARKLLDEFRAKLSKEDVKEFQRLKKCIRSKKWAAENPAKCRASDAKWRAKNPEKVKQDSAKWWDENPDYAAAWREKNPEKTKESNARWYAKNPEKSKKNSAKWKAENPEKANESSAKWRAENPDYAVAWRAENPDYHDDWRAENPRHHAEWRAANPEKVKKERSKPKNKLRNAVLTAFKRIGQNKPTNTLKLLGCTWEEAKAHFESLFLEGMTWENHGRGEGKWHIDHIRPVASFKGASEEELKQMNHISNLQPLWSADNIRKGDKWDGELNSEILNFEV
jgi:hypothetical protein